MTGPKPIREVLAELNDQRGIARKLELFFDGACEPKNPGGIATCGWIVRTEEGERIASGHCEVCRGPKATNNVAEWSALGFALRWLLDNRESVGTFALEIFGDSQLVINQLNDEWACNKEHLQALRARCRELLKLIAPVTWRASWIPRAENDAADALSRQAYVEASGKAFPERVRR